MAQHLIFGILTAALVIGALSAPAHTQGPGSTPPAVTSISGRVIDGSTQAPVSGALVTIGGSGVYGSRDGIFNIDGLDIALLDQGRPTTVRTDHLGRFAFNGLPPGTYGVRVSKDDWSTGAYGATRPGEPGQWLDVSAGQRVTATIAIWKHPWIGGIVVDDQGGPVERAAVQVLQWQFSTGRRVLEPVAQFQTDDRGEYGGTVPLGEYVVRAHSDQTRVRSWTSSDDAVSGFSSVFYPAARSPDGAEPVALAPGARFTNVNFQLPLQPMRRLAGQLTNPTGAGQLPRQVILIARDGLETRRGAAVDAQGRFIFERLFPGVYLLETFSARNLTPGTVPMLWARAIVDVQDADGKMTLDLRRGLIVRGRIAFDGPSPPTADLMGQYGVLMLAPPAVIGDDIPPNVQVQRDGTFALELPGGPYLARVLTGYTFSALPAGDRQPSESEFASLREWRLRSALVQGQDILDAPLELTADVKDLVVTFTKDNAAAQGRVRGGAGRPQDYRAVLIPAEPPLWPHAAGGRRFVAAPVLGNGQFTVRAPAGEYLLGAVRGLPHDWRNGDLIAQLARSMRSVQLVEGSPIVEIDPPVIEMPAAWTGAFGSHAETDTGTDVVRPEATADLPLPTFPGTTVTGRVVSAEDGQPLADVHVSAYRSPRFDGVFTDPAGRFVLRGVQSGRRTLYASKRAWTESGGAGMVLMIAGDRVDDIEVKMTHTAEITGTVTDQNGSPVQGADVRAWKYQPARDAVERVHRSYNASAATDEQGRYRLAGLPAGRYLVSTAASTRRDDTEIPETTQADVDRALGRAVPSPTTRDVVPPHGFPAVFNGGVADSTLAEPIELAPGSTRSVDLEIRSVRLTTVTVTLQSPDDAALPSLTARLEPSDRIIRSFSGLSEYPAQREAGVLVFENVLPGRYDFGARTSPRDGRYFSAFADVIVTESGEHNLTLDLMPGGTISGRLVVDGAPPRPGTGLVIRAFDVSNRMDFSIGESGATVADDGTFSLPNVMPGRYRLFLTAQGRTFEHVPVSQSVDGRETLHVGLAVSAGTVSNVQLSVVSKGFDVAGVVRDSTGRAVREATVVLFPADRAGWQPRSPHVLSVPTARDGGYVLSNVAPGDYRLAAANLEADVFMNAEALSKLSERSVAVKVGEVPSLTLDLKAP